MTSRKIKIVNGKTISASKTFRLDELNQKINSITPVWLFAVLIFVGTVCVFIIPQVISGNINLPAEVGDGPDYDSIAVQLEKGHGFTYDWNDPDFISVYKTYNESGQYDYLLNRRGKQPATERPPLLPAVMALCYRFFGRVFWPIRVLLSLSMALACTLLIILLVRRFGIIPGVFGLGVMIFITPKLGHFASVIMTESFACLVVATMVWLLLDTIEKRDWKSAAGLGIVTAIGFLNRSVLILWMPVIAAAVYGLTKPKSSPWLRWSSLQLPAFFLASFFIISAPWMVRNCIILKGFEPTGTMGSMNLSAGYSDRAFERRGLWFNLNKEGFFDQLEMDPSIPMEKAMADYSKKAAIQWIIKNPHKALLLVFFKIKGLWTPDSPAYMFCDAFALLGFLNLLIIRPKEALGILTFFVACSLSVGITWYAYGRFLVPVIPLLGILSALGLWGLVLASTDLVVDRLEIFKQPAVLKN